MLKTIMLAAGVLLASGTVMATAAEARVFRHAVGVQSASGHGYFRARTVHRHADSVSVRRNFQTNSGAGVITHRRANWDDGIYSSSTTRRFNNGASIGRATTMTNNGDGTASYTTTRTGIDGHSVTRSGTFGPR